MRQYVKISLGLLKPSGFSQAMLGLTLALVMLWSSAAAEEFAFSLPHLENIADAEVIPGGAVTALAQDVRGLIWIGTQKGLIRYDGYRFRRFVHAPADPTSLADDFVMSLLAAKDGKIWIGSNSNGLTLAAKSLCILGMIRHKQTASPQTKFGRWSAMHKAGFGPLPTGV
jgi:ligand-binding sensor domain-containing protein